MATMLNIINRLKSPQTEEIVIKALLANMAYIRSSGSKRETDRLSGDAYNQFVAECVANNQYISLSREDYNDIYDLYVKLLQSLRNLDEDKIDYGAVRGIVLGHRKRLIDRISDIAEPGSPEIIVPCAEYSNQLQVEILRLTPDIISEPIIDIGCGKEFRLVKSLSKDYREVFGIDQYQSSAKNVIRENWLDFHFKPGSWGTIISHMAFSNHFRRAIAFNSKDLSKYEAKYREILKALKPGGRFVYTPCVPEIEDKIDRKKYKIIYYENIANTPIMATAHIKRLFNKEHPELNER